MAGTERLTPEGMALLERCFREQYAALVRYATVLLRDRGIAEIAVQDAFETAALRYDAFSGSEDPAGWLRGVVYNKAREIRREQKMMLRRYVPLELVPESADEDFLPSNLAAHENADVRLLYRFYIEGYSIRELAKESGKSEGAMKMELKRARDRLRNAPNFPDLLYW